MEQHNLYLPFLDIMTNKDRETNKILIEIYYIKTDTRICVPLNSCHPKQCKNSIPYTLARRTCTNSEVRKKRLDELQNVLYSQKYPQNLVQEAIRKVTSIHIENSRASKVKTDINNLVFITTFNPYNKHVLPLIQTAFKLLQQQSETKECFKNIKLRKSKTTI